MRSVIQSVHRAHYGIWMNVPNPSGHGLRLWLSHRGAEGFQLAVDIGERYHVAIHQGQRSNSGAGQTLGGIAANAPKTEENHMGRFQPRLGFRPPEHLISQKTSVYDTFPHSIQEKRSRHARPAPFCYQPTNFKPKSPRVIVLSAARPSSHAA